MNTTRTATRIALVAVSALLLLGAGCGSTTPTMQIDPGAGGPTTSDLPDPGQYVAQRKQQMAHDRAARAPGSVGKRDAHEVCGRMPERKYAGHPLLICRVVR